MKARYTDFSNGVSLKECSFHLPQNLDGFYFLQTIYKTEKVKLPKESWIYSYEEMMQLNGFIISNIGKNTTKRSTYKTSKSFINRLKKERNEKM